METKIGRNSNNTINKCVISIFDLLLILSLRLKYKFLIYVTNNNNTTRGNNQLIKLAFEMHFQFSAPCPLNEGFVQIVVIIYFNSC